MAEFQEVMKQWRRMCEKNRIDCMRFCPICANPTCGELAEATDEDIRKAEDKVMAWAAEHPEPIYPTWYEYLSDYYRAAFGDMSVISKQPIPADIAQKLGLEPKEG